MRSPGQSQHKTLKAATDYTNYTNYSSLILGQYRLSNVMVKMLYEELSYDTVGAALEVHRVLGPGFLEAVYEQALAHELALRRIPFERQVSLDVAYKEIKAGEYRADFLIDAKIVIELKAVSSLNAA